MPSDHRNPARRASVPERIALAVPGVSSIARLVRRVADYRVGRVPLGLIALLPASLLLDFFDAADELALGPVGMATSFVLETAFLLGVTGRGTWALGGAGIDLIPGVDVLPIATITLLGRIAEAWREGAPDEGRHAPTGPVIDV